MIEATTYQPDEEYKDYHKVRIEMEMGQFDLLYHLILENPQHRISTPLNMAFVDMIGEHNKENDSNTIPIRHERM